MNRKIAIFRKVVSFPVLLILGIFVVLLYFLRWILAPFALMDVFLEDTLNMPTPRWIERLFLWREAYHWRR